VLLDSALLLWGVQGLAWAAETHDPCAPAVVGGGLAPWGMDTVGADHYWILYWEWEEEQTTYWEQGMDSAAGVLGLPWANEKVVVVVVGLQAVNMRTQASEVERAWD